MYLDNSEGDYKYFSSYFSCLLSLSGVTLHPVAVSCVWRVLLHWQLQERTGGGHVSVSLTISPFHHICKCGTMWFYPSYLFCLWLYEESDFLFLSVPRHFSIITSGLSTFDTALTVAANKHIYCAPVQCYAWIKPIVKRLNCLFYTLALLSQLASWHSTLTLSDSVLSLSSLYLCRGVSQLQARSFVHTSHLSLSRAPC